MWPILLITIIPVTEEVLFRGVLLSRWGVKWGIGTGIVLTAVIFGAMNRFDAVEATVLGVVAALLYLQSRTLIVPIGFHAANNLVGKVVGDALAWEEALAPAAKLEEIEAMALPGVAMLAVTLPVLVWYVRRNWPSRDAEIPYTRNAG
ncbi:CPBP family intramembrane glutamic endopeptidase [Candidatus Palauibacter sp.]|uniref:CPBP family intramembrane glutamic endopeptidase n=1 Tax=Candidatus Palauibacter sp. TaxID=3101350 RepID=UPI003B590690